jgi:hypothetical protein
VRVGLFSGIRELKFVPALRRWELDNQRTDRLQHLRCGILRGNDGGVLLALHEWVLSGIDRPNGMLCVRRG